jgi:hypothetical protein
MAKVGRPKEDLSSLPDNWHEEVLELYSEGAADVEIKALIYEWRGTFSCDLWNRWMKDYEEFSITIKRGRMLSESWWNKSGRKNLKDKDFSYTGWYMNMKNRFGWRDKQETTLQGGDKAIKTETIISLGTGIKPD